MKPNKIKKMRHYTLMHYHGNRYIRPAGREKDALMKVWSEGKGKVNSAVRHHISEQRAYLKGPYIYAPDPLTVSKFKARALNRIDYNPMNLARLLKWDEPGEMIGVEMECFSELHNSDKLISDHESRPVSVTAKYDGSISGGRGGVELVLVCKDSRWAPLENACRWAAKNELKVNKSCGLHIHLDMRGVAYSDVRRRYERLWKFVLGVGAWMQPASRRNNHYCNLAKNDHDRYRAVNWCSYDTHKTIEVRLGAASVNAHKIKMWAQWLVWASRETYVRYPTIESTHDERVEFVKKYARSRDMRAWALNRLDVFKDLSAPGPYHEDNDDDDDDHWSAPEEEEYYDDCDCESCRNER